MNDVTVLCDFEEQFRPDGFLQRLYQYRKSSLSRYFNIKIDKYKSNFEYRLIINYKGKVIYEK